MSERVAPTWHEFTAEVNFADGLEPHFAAHRRFNDRVGDEAPRVEFTARGERWTAKLYYQESGIVDPGYQLPTGTTWEFENVREYRIAINRHSDEDDVGLQGFNAHIRPRWQGMEVETDDGDTFELSIPDEITEGVSVRLSGSNVDAHRYLGLLRAAAKALDINPTHFRDYHSSSTVQDGERYVRVHEDASGPVHARDGPIAQMGHLLENDREGYRKVVQNDTDDHGQKVPGHYHTATLGPKRVQEAFPSHSAPVEVKHYRAREALAIDPDNPLRHPKVGVSYQVSRWDSSVPLDDLDELQRELDRTLHSVLDDADVTRQPGADGGPFVSDAYFAAEMGEFDDPPELNLSRIKNEQENIVVRELTKNGGFSPVELEALDTLVTDGGKVSPADIAEQHGRHVGSVRRALRRMEDVFDREYGEVGLRSPYVAEMVQSAVQQMRDASQRLADVTGQALLDAERGVEKTAAALRSWCERYGVEVDSRGDAIEKIRMGEMPRTGRNGFQSVRVKLRDGLALWCDAGHDRAKFLAGKVEWTDPKRGHRSFSVSNILN
ncbi:MarR family transcriptional regulator [Halolamina sp. CBA1230]|uniref:DUF7845 domain-containing protein n=1 Tax=Halolamina sp. CBA1230 TaxID=1853690 RepID=UPI0009A16C5D|nr:MarR family transcriptional regulator [Halolamina sp. CBA1230]QKY20598.1 MarR family transcriptional regulator [Halolamina sp. CBA1230]